MIAEIPVKSTFTQHEGNIIIYSTKDSSYESSDLNQTLNILFRDRETNEVRNIGTLFLDKGSVRNITNNTRPIVQDLGYYMSFSESTIRVLKEIQASEPSGTKYFVEKKIRESEFYIDGNFKPLDGLFIPEDGVTSIVRFCIDNPFCMDNGIINVQPKMTSDDSDRKENYPCLDDTVLFPTTNYKESVL